jgi:hypothetical protein
MSDNATELVKYYYRLGIPPRYSAARYFAALRRFIRCPRCHQDAFIEEGYFVCSHCGGKWIFTELLYPRNYMSAPALSSSRPVNGNESLHSAPTLMPLGNSWGDYPRAASSISVNGSR